MRRPVSLTIAVVLQWLAAVVGLISAFDLIQAAFSMSEAGLPAKIEAALVTEGVGDVSGSTVVAGVFLAGVLVGALALVRIMVAVYLGRGRGWARIVLTILVGLNLVGGLAYLFQGYLLRASVTVVVEVFLLWLMFNAESNAYMRERSAA